MQRLLFSLVAAVLMMYIGTAFAASRDVGSLETLTLPSPFEDPSSLPSCQGDTCSGRDPAEAGCLLSAITLDSVPLTRQDGTRAGMLQLIYSQDCGAFFGSLVNFVRAPFTLAINAFDINRVDSSKTLVFTVQRPRRCRVPFPLCQPMGVTAITNTPMASAVDRLGQASVTLVIAQPSDDPEQPAPSAFPQE